ncbi:MAG: cytidine deaminase [Planctomycetota bacterium]|nr:MAG: cytidine deaminase [Planctomycetota bacterium]
MTPEQLVNAAREARTRAHAPYSAFRVGAALLDEHGGVHLGANVENASYGLSCCAERVAVFRAVADGVTRFTQIAVISRGGVAPCGACRQVLNEFAPDLTLHLADETGPHRTLTLSTLLPEAFGPAQLTADVAEHASAANPRAARTD